MTRMSIKLRDDFIEKVFFTKVFLIIAIFIFFSTIMINEPLIELPDVGMHI